MRPTPGASRHRRGGAARRQPRDHRTGPASRAREAAGGWQLEPRSAELRRGDGGCALRRPAPRLLRSLDHARLGPGPRAGKWDNSAVMERHPAGAPRAGAAARVRQLRRLRARDAHGAQRARGHCTSSSSCDRRAARPRNGIARTGTVRRPRARRLGRRLLVRAAAARALHAYRRRSCDPTFRCRACSQGLFEVAERLFGVRIEERTGVPVWHPDARYFEIAERRGGAPLGSFYLDAVRPRRTSAAAPGWTSASAASASRPAPRCRWPTWCAISCRRAGGQPALLTHDDVVTLFHEFGHGLHHLLTRVEYPASPASTAWPGMRSSCRASSWRTMPGTGRCCGASPAIHDRRRRCPRAAAEADRHAQLPGRAADAAAARVRAVRFPPARRVFDPARGGRVAEVLGEVRARGGGGAGARLEPLSAQLRAHLRRRLRGRLLQLQMGRGAGGRRLRGVRGERRVRSAHRAALSRRILSHGGSRDALEAFVEFRGRRPDVRALLRQHGILPRGDSR